VTSADPLAVVVDIDLSGNAGDAEKDTSGTLELRRFLESYRGNAPLLFPATARARRGRQVVGDAKPLRRRVRGERSPALGARELRHGPGAVRAWAPWIEVCTRPIDEPGTAERDIAVAHTQWLAAIPVQLVRSSAVKLAYDDAPPLSGDCRGRFASHRSACSWVLGSREVDRCVVVCAHGLGRNAARARDPARDVAALHETHRADRRDASGLGRLLGHDERVIPGVELIANSVRYAPLQQETSRGSRCGVAQGARLLRYFAVITWQMRGVPMLFTVLVVTLLLVVLAIGVFDRYDVFDALESAILLTILYKAAVEILTLFEEGRIHWRANAGRPGPAVPHAVGHLLATPPPVEETHV
jgi:hypothetical protein